MRLISARQAWHDAFYESRSSVLAVAADKAALGKKGRVAKGGKLLPQPQVCS